MRTLLKKLTSLLFIIIFFCQVSQGQDYKIFQDTEVNITTTNDLFISPETFRAVSLNEDIFVQKISNIPQEIDTKAKNSSTVLTFPLPDGSEEEFRVVEYSMMESELAAAFPNIKTYIGVGAKDPLKTIRFDYTLHGLRAVMRLEGEMVYIDPVDKNNSGNYVCYYRKNLQNEQVHTCHSTTEVDDLEEEDLTAGTTKSAHCGFRKYTIAVATTAEYSNYYSATSPADEALVLSAVVTSFNRVNEIYERDLGIRLVLVNGTEVLFYYDAASDPYTNSNASIMLAENQTNITAVIGAANYDIGHVLSTSNGGVAAIDSPCREAYKARGVTGLSIPEGDLFDIDFLCHEIGHQFGANHTFNNSCGGNVNFDTAVEPGSGSTIMGYAGTCAPNVQSSSDAYFHALSMSQINAFLNSSTGTSCATIIGSANNQPAADAGNDLIIPRSTPFYLQGSGSDIDGDSLTFCWEQMDSEISPQSPVDTSAVGPTFRSYSPTVDSLRYFPNLSDLSLGGATPWEILPAVSRDLNFRLTVRDNSIASAGCFAFDDMIVSVDSTAGPFVVTIPNDAGISWREGSRQTVTWDVANTDISPINCSKVDILLSYDGGLSYPVTLLTNVDNDGSAQVTIPAGTTTTAKIMVKSVGNVFFDISNNDFTIAAGNPNFFLSIQNPEKNVCAGDDVVYDVTVGSIADFSETILLSVENPPAGLSIAFSSNPIIAGGTTDLIISGTANPPLDDYNLELSAISIADGIAALPKTIDFVMNLGAKPGSTIQVSPSNNEENIALRPNFTWNAAANATSYELQVSIDPSFTTVNQSIESDSIYSTLIEDLESATSYFWRVRALADCGVGTWSIPLRFTTHYCSFYVQDTDMAVNDNGDAYSDLTINDEGSVVSIQVLNVAGTHDWIEDLTASLISPSATEVTLWSNLCGSTNDFSLSLNDNALESLANITCEPLGAGASYQPEGNLSDFSTESTNGNWRLKLNDNWSGETGILNTWSLKVCIENYIAADIIQEEETALPIELLSFDAKAQSKTILLEWEAMHEDKLSAYEVERKKKTDTDFSTIGLVEVIDNQILKNEYNFEDEAIEKEVIYQYRLRMIDYSGEITYSQVEEAQIRENNLSLNIYPNPAQDVVYIDVLGDENKEYEIGIIDIAGKKIADYNLKSGNNTLNISNFPNGIYIVKSKGEQSFAQQKLVIH